MSESNATPGCGSIASTILEQLRLPVFLVDRDAAVRYANAAAAKLLVEGAPFRVTDNVLGTESISDNAQLKVAITNASSKGERETIMVSDIRYPKPQIVSVVPLTEVESRPNGRAIVVMQRCEVMDDVFVHSLRQLFRLSTAETAIAGALVCGADPEQIAGLRGAKIATVRTQIAAIMLKTRTRRQGELVALLSRIGSLP